MARPKKQVNGEVQASNGHAGGGKVSKTDAVKDALDKLGRDAKPSALRDYVKEHFGLDMSLNHISNIKSSTGGKKGRRGRPGRRPASESAVATAEPTARVGRVGSAGSVSLADVEMAKQLAERVGPKNLKNLIDLISQ